MPHHSHETKTRSILKASTWWVVIFVVDIAIILFLTREITTSLVAVVLTNGVGAAVYFFHERAWSKIFFGLRPHTQTDLD